MRMNKYLPRGIVSRPLAVGLLCLLPTAFSLACEEPSYSFQLPDGKSASEEEMAAAQQSVKDFVARGEAYIACLDGDSSLTSAAKDRRRGTTIDQMQAVAANFNRELRSFRKR